MERETQGWQLGRDESINNQGQVIPLIIPSEKTEINEPENAANQSTQDVETDELINTTIEIDSSHVPKSQLIKKLRKLRPKMWSDDE